MQWNAGYAGCEVVDPPGVGLADDRRAPGAMTDPMCPPKSGRIGCPTRASSNDMGCNSIPKHSMQAIVGLGG